MTFVPRPSLDIDAVLRRITVSAEGWSKATLAFGPFQPDQRGIEGLVDPDGIPWEPIYSWKTRAPPRNLREVAQRVVSQELGGYAHRLIVVGDETWVVERFLIGTQLRIWDGLRAVGAWDDSGPCPWQSWAHAEWVRPGGHGEERVTLYLRHRDWGIDPEGCVWTGYVQRCDGGPLEAIRAPWSPNLLPTLAPRDVPPPTPEPAHGGFLTGLFGPPKPPPPEVGYLEEDLARAKADLIRRAATWLHEHGADAAAWETVCPKPGTE